MPADLTHTSGMEVHKWRTIWFMGDRLRRVKAPASSIFRRFSRKPQGYAYWIFLKHTEGLSGVGRQEEVFPSLKTAVEQIDSNEAV